MADQLRRVPGSPADLGIYRHSGSLDGVRPGRRVVRRLTISGLTGDSGEGLRPLAAFEHLRALTLYKISGVDLSPLAELAIEELRIELSTDLDLGPLSALPSLASLELFDLMGCASSSRLTLDALRELNLSTDRRGLNGESVQAVIEAIDWSRLSRLRILQIRVGALEAITPIEVDIGFLRELSQLERLDMFAGVRHDGRGPNPLEPPFDGLPTTLTWLRFDAWNPDVIQPAIRSYLGRQEAVHVYPRGDPTPDAGSWSVDAPSDDGVWSTYGCLADVFETETEAEALELAERKIRAADPELLARLDFDPESSGTGIMAAAREDIEAALRILAISDA